MSKIPFGLALIDTLDLIEEAFIKKTRVLFQFRFNLDSNLRFSERKLSLEAVNSINGGTCTVQLQGVFTDRLCFALGRDYKYP